jgi:hypothetical protein
MRSSEGAMVGLALLAFVGVSLWFIAQSAPQSKQYAPLSSYSPSPNGTMALYELLEACGIPTERYLQGEYHYPKDGVVVLTDQSMPDPTVLLGGGLDAKALSLWLADGGRMVLLASPQSLNATALMKELTEQADSPLFKHNFGYPSADLQAVHRAAGTQSVRVKHVRPGTPGTTAVAREARQGEVYSFPDDALPLFAGIEEIEAARPDYEGLGFGAPLLRLVDPPSSLVLWTPVGQGELLWVLIPEVATNAWIARADNNRLLLNLLAYASRGGPVYFDEYFHGYREQGPNVVALLTGTAGGQLMLAFVALLVIAFAGSAIAPARYVPDPIPARRQAREMVLAQAGLYQRAGLRRPIAELLVDGLRQDLRQRLHLVHTPDNAELLAWVARSGTGASGMGGVSAASVAIARDIDPILPAFLQEKVVIGSPPQLLRLAQACDALKRGLG